MRIHVGERSNLRQIYRLTVSKGDNLVEGEDEFEGVIGHFVLVDCATNVKCQKGRLLVRCFSK